jgi:hypothetical protein
MRLSLSAALLLLAGSTVWGFSPAARRALVRSSFRGSFQSISPLKATIDNNPSLIMKQSQRIAEAKQCLTDIEGAVQTARGYLYYLEEVAQTVKGYLDSKDTGNTSAAKEYLVNIEKAASSAQEYLQYLEGVAASVREHLSKMESFTPQEKDAEKKTRSILEDLEETARAAKEYLAYLQGVASAVQQFLATPTSPPPPELANLLGGTPPDFPAPPTLPKPPILQTLTPPALPTEPSVPVVASTPAASNGAIDTSSSGAPSKVGGGGGGGGMTSYLDSVQGASRPSFGSDVDKSTFAAPSPPAPAPAARATISLGTSSQAPAVPQTSGSYLDTISSGASPVGGGGGMTSYLDSVAGASLPSFGSGVGATPSAPVPDVVQPAPLAPVPAYQPPAPQASRAASTGSYLDNISSSPSAARPSRGGMQTFADSLQPGISASVALDKRDTFAAKGIKSYTDSLTPGTVAKKKRKDGEPIPPQMRVLGAEYMDQLNQAAQNNPLVLKDELEKRHVGEDKAPTSSTKKGPSSYLDSLQTSNVEKETPAETTSVKKAAEKQVDGIVGPGATGIFLIFFLLFLSLAQFLLPLPDQYFDQFLSVPEPVEQAMQPSSPPVDAQSEIIEKVLDLNDWSF